MIVMLYNALLINWRDAMQNLKVKVNSAEESKEAQELFFELGYGFEGNEIKEIQYFEYVGEFYFFAYGDDCDLTHSCDSVLFTNKPHKEITIPQLKDMVVLKRNNVSDATHEYRKDCGNHLKYRKFDDGWYFFGCNGWRKSTNTDHEKLKPIQNNDLPFIDSEKDVKEFLEPMPNGDYRYHLDDGFSIGGDWIEIPCDAVAFIEQKEVWKGFINDMSYVGCGAILWQRNPQQDSLNDKVVSAEVSRQGMKADNVNNPSHYNKGNIECIEAIKASMTHEAFCGYLKGNILKYTWRYEVKGWTESLQKAQWYTNRLLEELSNG